VISGFLDFGSIDDIFHLRRKCYEPDGLITNPSPLRGAGIRYTEW
jgi:hypothetical protein